MNIQELLNKFPKPNMVVHDHEYIKEVLTKNGVDINGITTKKDPTLFLMETETDVILLTYGLQYMVNEISHRIFCLVFFDKSEISLDEFDEKLKSLIGVIKTTDTTIDEYERNQSN